MNREKLSPSFPTGRSSHVGGSIQFSMRWANGVNFIQAWPENPRWLGSANSVGSETKVADKAPSCASPMLAKRKRKGALDGAAETGGGSRSQKMTPRCSPSTTNITAPQRRHDHFTGWTCAELMAAAMAMALAARRKPAERF